MSNLHYIALTNISLSHTHTHTHTHSPSHSLVLSLSLHRDCHVLHFSCDGLTARFDFTPIHPYALHVRSGMSFPSDFHNRHSLRLLHDLPLQFSALFEGFRRSISLIQLTAEEVLILFSNICYFLIKSHTY